MESGISTFVELTPDPITGKTISAYQRLQNLMEEIELADQLGLDVFAIGEHHRFKRIGPKRRRGPFAAPSRWKSKGGGPNDGETMAANARLALKRRAHYFPRLLKGGRRIYDGRQALHP